jgi:hypothetical protein
MWQGSTLEGIQRVLAGGYLAAELLIEELNARVRVHGRVYGDGFCL